MKRYLFLFAALLGFLFLILALNSCSITKAKKTFASDSTHVSKIDSGSIKQNINSAKSDSTWKREIIYFGKDTVTNNYYTTPAVIYRESGSQSKQFDSSNLQTNFNKSIDSGQVKTVLSEKKKEERALSIWQIIGIAVGASIVISLLSKLKISFKP